jgi:enoyl-CoA hydratase/carnithine racemase
MSPDTFAPEHFRWGFADGVATITLDRPERKNPLTFESYAELRDTFRELVYAPQGEGGGRDRRGRQFQLGRRRARDHRPAHGNGMPGLLKFTRMTGDLVKAMRLCPQPIVAALDGVCVGAGAIVAMASDVRLATPETKTAFLFTRVGLAGCDMGACAILPRIIGQGRASELLFTGRVMSAEEGRALGLPQSAGASRTPARRSNRLRPLARQRPHLRARHHQDAAPSGMERQP